jgi:hypothetical protein
VEKLKAPLTSIIYLLQTRLSILVLIATGELLERYAGCYNWECIPGTRTAAVSAGICSFIIHNGVCSFRGQEVKFTGYDKAVVCRDPMWLCADKVISKPCPGLFLEPNPSQKAAGDAAGK